MKKRFAFILALVLCAALLCVGALAAEGEYDLWVDGEQVTEANAADVLGDGTVSYDAESNTLTLNGAELTEYAEGGYGVIDSYNGLTIKLVGENTITAEYAAAVNCDYDVVFCGDGTLEASAAGTYEEDGQEYTYTVISAGSVKFESGTYNLHSEDGAVVYTFEGSVEITGSADVTATSVNSIAVWSTNYLDGDCDIIVSGNAKVGAKSDYSLGIYANGNVTVSDSAEVSAIVKGSQTAIASDGAMTVEGGRVYAESAKGNAIYAVSGGLHISGGYVEALSKDGAPAVSAPGIIELTGGELTATAYGSIAIQATNEEDPYGEFVVTNAKVTATSHPNGLSSPPPAIYAPADIRISGGSEVTVVSEGYGIYSNTTISIEDSSVSAESATGWGIVSRGLSISGSSVSAKGASYALYTAGSTDISITDSRVTASSAENYAIASTGGLSMTDSVVTAVSPEGKNSVYGKSSLILDGTWLVCSGSMSVGSTEAVVSREDCVCFTGETGRTYGDATVSADAEVPEGTTLHIMEGTTLTVPDGVKLDNNGTIIIRDGGALTNNGTIDNRDGTIIRYGEFENNGAVIEREYSIPETHEITVEQPANGSVSTSLTNSSAGAKITVTATPNAGYELAYITVDGEPIEGDSFTMPDHGVTVSAVFTDGFPFADVPAGSWYREYVEYVYANGLMDGTSAAAFEPDAGMTRAMVWAILARMDGETVTGTAWQAQAKAWAVANGVSDGTDPNGLVTREQFAAMLWRYAGEPATAANLDGYTDGAGVSAWAVDAMAWAVEKGIITGVTDTTLAPRGTATRAQCAAMLMRFDTM